MGFILQYKKQLIAVLILLPLLAVGVYLALNPTVFRPRASETRLILEGANGSSSVSVTPNTQSTVSLVLDPGGREIAGFDAVLAYDPNLLEINQNDLSAPEVPFPTISLIDNGGGSGVIKVSALAYNRTDPNSSRLVNSRAVVARIRFKLKSASQASIRVDNASVVAGKQGDNVLSSNYSTITITPSVASGTTPYTCNVFEAYTTDGAERPSYPEGTEISYVARFRVTGWSSNDQTILHYLGLYDNTNKLNIQPLCSNRGTNAGGNTSDWSCSWDGIKVGAAGNHDLRIVLRDSSISAADRTACSYSANATNKYVSTATTGGGSATNLRLSGKAYIDADGNGQRSGSEQPVAGILVTLTKDNNQVGSFTTNNEGNYLFENLSSGRYRISFTNIPSGYQRSTDDGFEFDLSANREIEFGIKQ